MTLPEGLLATVKNYPGIDITWADTSIDAQLTGLIGLGMKFLDGKAGSVLDYSTDGMPKQLLFEYVKYARNGILNEYVNNLTPFLMDLRVGNGGAYGSEETAV
jgi:hypothetical protein